MRMAYFYRMGVAFQVKAQFYGPKDDVVVEILQSLVKNFRYIGIVPKGDDL